MFHWIFKFSEEVPWPHKICGTKTETEFALELRFDLFTELNLLNFEIFKNGQSNQITSVIIRMISIKIMK